MTGIFNFQHMPTSEQRPPVNNSHKFRVPRVVVVVRKLIFFIYYENYSLIDFRRELIQVFFIISKETIGEEKMRNFQNLLLVSLLTVTLFVTYTLSAAVGQVLTMDTGLYPHLS
jgi:hypothetical protein